MSFWRPWRRDPLICRYLGSEKQNKYLLESTQARLLLVGFLFFVGFCGIGWRLFDVSIFQADRGEEMAHQTSMMSQRADFVDKNGVLLATSLRTFSLYANPRVILNAQSAANRLHQVFPELSVSSLRQKLSSQKGFVWISRHLTPGLHAQVLKLGIPGVYVMKDQRRVYPHGSLFSHILGMTTWDHVGVSGLEKGLNSQLKDSENPVRLSVDVRLQHILHEEIQASIEMFQAKGGNGILIKRNHNKKWEILCMVSLPDFDPNRFQEATQEGLFNRNTAGVYEFGSLLKIHNTAMVLDKGVATLNSIYDASVPLRVGRFQITDFKGKHRPLSVEEAFLYSSNIANAKMALSAGADAQKNFMEKLGFYKLVSLELPELAAPMMPTVWKEPTVITASYGYGLSITPLHLIQSVATFLDGYKRDLTFLPVENAPENPGEQILSPQLVRQMRALLRRTLLEGNAKLARVEGYEVGGKTGTANIQEKGRYIQKNNRTSFVGAFPIEDPEYVLLVTLDRAQPNQLTHGYATAGWIAAPLAARVIKRMAPILGLIPHQPENPGWENQSPFLIHVSAPTHEKGEARGN